ncbi:hypothetical protein [Pseudomonas syringae]|uniref:hypothetical protein n=1 Tax=Pseudomonas syringae TaxID=317 RepID=UPI0024640629|nr:hypothetical protein [Pseudomonas syringae]MDH4602461.1 hypothetical protein [Pseudomonas syringae pv. papulans]
MKAMPKIGVALYASGSPFSSSGNFACEFRGVPFSFGSASDLPGQTLWVTNSSWDELKEAGLHRNPKIAHDGYYRTKLSQMANELGLKTLPLEQQAPFLAELLGNAAEMARIQLGLTQFPSSGLSQAVGQLHGSHEAAVGSAVSHAAEQACQRYTACERDRRHKQSDIFSFWFPRHSFSEFLLQSPLPDNQVLQLIPMHRLPSNGRDTVVLVEWAQQMKLPLFARIKILALEPVLGRLLNYGSGAQDVSGTTRNREYQARNMREWCALPELEALSQSGEVEVLEVAIAGGWTKSGLTPFSNKFASVSYAYGLVAENLWFGLTRKCTPAAQISKSLSTAWLQSLDRMKCLAVAERLHNLGMEVMNYGNGRITVECPVSIRSAIPQFALEEQILYPASLENLIPAQNKQRSATNVLQQLLESRDYSRIIDVDQSALRELRASRGVK